MARAPEAKIEVAPATPSKVEVLNKSLGEFSWMTFLIVLVAVIIVVVGGIVVITGNMTYEEYVNNLWKFAGAVGLLGVGRGIHNGLSQQGTKSQ